MQTISAAPLEAATVHRELRPRSSTLANRLGQLRPELYGLARSLTKDPAAADDLVQETLVKAIRSGAQFRRGTDLRAWSRTILRNAFLDARRKRGAFQELGQEPPWSPTDDTVGPRDVLTIEDVKAAATTLDPETQQIFSLACFEQVSYKEIAVRFQIAPATVGTRLLRARAKLRRRLQEVFEKRVAALSAPGEARERIADVVPLRSGASRHIVRVHGRHMRGVRAGAGAAGERCGQLGPDSPARLGRENRTVGRFGGNNQAHPR